MAKHRFVIIARLVYVLSLEGERFVNIITFTVYPPKEYDLRRRKSRLGGLSHYKQLNKRLQYLTRTKRVERLVNSRNNVIIIAKDYLYNEKYAKYILLTSPPVAKLVYSKLQSRKTRYDIVVSVTMLNSVHLRYDSSADVNSKRYFSAITNVHSIKDKNVDILVSDSAKTFLMMFNLGKMQNLSHRCSLCAPGKKFTITITRKESKFVSGKRIAQLSNLNDTVLTPNREGMGHGNKVASCVVVKEDKVRIRSSRVNFNILGIYALRIKTKIIAKTGIMTHIGTGSKWTEQKWDWV